MAEETLPKKWGKLDDRKLSDLFRKGERSGVVSSTDLNAKDIRKVLKAHFPNQEYKNFAPLFRSKARAWNIDQTLTGQHSKFVVYHFTMCHTIVIISIDLSLIVVLLASLRENPGGSCCQGRGERGLRCC
jgi:hypothetical protein